MIISRTPHRISFFGGGTDYPSYYLNHSGKTLGVTIDKYCYLSVRKLPPFFNHKHRIVYSSQENVQSLDEIKHPSVREVLKYLKIDYGVAVHHDGDIPARSGMGSSSAFTVGLLKSMMALENKMIDDRQLTKEAIHVEQNLIRENVGSQDQTFAAYGGFNLVEFRRDGEIVVNPVIISPKRLRSLEQKFMLFFTGISRIASTIAGEQIRNTGQNIANLAKMKEIVDEAHNILVDETRPLKEFGQLLNETWRLKKTLSGKISNDQIDAIYQSALEAGATGGKLLGAGGGGFLVFYVDQEKQSQVKQALEQFLHIPFQFDFDGSKIIVYQPEHL